MLKVMLDTAVESKSDSLERFVHSVSPRSPARAQFDSTGRKTALASICLLWLRVAPLQDDDGQSGTLKVLTRMLSLPAGLGPFDRFRLMPKHHHHPILAVPGLQLGQSHWKPHCRSPTTPFSMASRSAAHALGVQSRPQS